MMPGMNGIELCQKSKSDARTSHINFIMLTAKTAQASKEQGLEAGADDYLTKPFHMYELVLRITNLIQQQANYRIHLKDKLLPQSPLSSQPHVDDIFLEKVYAYLNDNLTNPALDVESLASEMAMSKSTLNRKLKALLNTTVADFIKQFRLQKAVEIIVSGHNISKAAYDVGFESPSYFSQCFKEVYNLSPSDYQKTLA
jgi:AraC-like DNA-binding protein